MVKYNEELWKKIMVIGKSVESVKKTNSINPFDDDDINTILGTMEFFNATDIWMRQTCFDLKTARYRLFDWLAMCVMSRNDDDRANNNHALKILVHSYLKVEGDPRAFIADLRETDYQLQEREVCDNIDIDVAEVVE